MRRSLWHLILVPLVALPLLAQEPGPQPPAPPPPSQTTPSGLEGPFDLYGTFWFPGLCEAEWSPFLSPAGPMNFWDAYTWGFVRFRYWFDMERYGWGWPPNGSPLGWGWDGWYGGWYGWLPDGVPAWMGTGFYSPVVAPLQVRPMLPAEVVAPRPAVQPPKVHKGWFGGALRPAAPDEGFSNRPEDWSRGALAGGGFSSRPGPGGGVRQPARPAPSPVTTRPPVRRW